MSQEPLSTDCSFLCSPTPQNGLDNRTTLNSDFVLRVASLFFFRGEGLVFVFSDYYFIAIKCCIILSVWLLLSLFIFFSVFGFVRFLFLAWLLALSFALLFWRFLYPNTAVYRLGNTFLLSLYSSELWLLSLCYEVLPLYTLSSQSTTELWITEGALHSCLIARVFLMCFCFIPFTVHSHWVCLMKKRNTREWHDYS